MSTGSLPTRGSSHSVSEDRSHVSTASGTHMRARMVARSPAEAHRAATPLELFFDLVFVVAPEGTDFQRVVWSALRTIPEGTTISYRELAARIGKPDAVRAVGLANGRNPIPIVVPCHRVIGANGSLTGFGGGLERKQWLLAHEGYFHLSGRTTVNTALAVPGPSPGHALR